MTINAINSIPNTVKVALVAGAFSVSTPLAVATAAIFGVGSLIQRCQGTRNRVDAGVQEPIAPNSQNVDAAVQEPTSQTQDLKQLDLDTEIAIAKSLKESEMKRPESKYAEE